MIGLRFYGNSRAGIEEMKVPVPGEGEVLLEIVVSALCGSERNDYLNGCINISGHEFAGVVRNSNSSSRIRKGDRVSVNVLTGCGKCYFCRTGQTQFCREMKICHGGHAQYAVVPESCCILLPEEMDFENGLLLGGDTLGVAYRAVNKLRSDFGRIAVVIGAGPIGLGVISLLKYYGYYVVVWEINQYRRNYAKEVCRADEAVDSGTKEAIEELERLTNQLGADAVFECSGNAAAQKTALEIVRPKGTVVFCGENYKGLEIVPSVHLIHKEVMLTGAFYFTKNDFFGLCEIYRRGFDANRAVSHMWHLSEAAKACEMFFSGQTGKVLLTR